jgi:peptidoglycan glycosyltransferase
MRRRWLYGGAVLSVAMLGVVTWRLFAGSHPNVVQDLDETTLAQVSKSKVPVNPAAVTIPTIAGLDLSKISVDERGASAPAADKHVARLTVDPELQRTAVDLMRAHHLPEAAVVVIDVTTSAVLAYASHIEKGPARDLCAEATAPAASVFKIITGSALVEDAKVSLEEKFCYSGGEQRIHPVDLVEDRVKDKWCVTLGGAMGRSINTVFARLAKNNLKPQQLDMMARRYGFGDPVPFDVPVQPSAINVPEEPLEFARTAAGFWNTTLSPIQAAWMSATVARGGEAMRPMIVKDVVDDGGKVVYTAPASPMVRRAVTRETASAVTGMMEHTVNDGTSFRAFHDARAKAFLPGIPVAGKTGTLTDAQTNRFYTWFSAFAPSRFIPNGPRQVAIAVLVVNEPTWSVKANVIARDMLRAYFAQQKIPNVTKPSTTAIARHANATRSKSSKP